MQHDTLSEKAAAMARAAFPDSLPLSERREGRNAYLMKHRRELFDVDKDGCLNFEEYFAAEWAGYLAQVPVGQYYVTRQDFLLRFLGDPASPSSGWHVPWQVSSMEQLYKSIDVNNKGHINEEDLRPRAMLEFKAMDKNEDGCLSIKELK